MAQSEQSVLIPTGNLLRIVPQLRCCSSSQQEILHGLSLGIVRSQRGHKTKQVLPPDSARQNYHITAKVFVGPSLLDQLQQEELPQAPQLDEGNLQFSPAYEALTQTEKFLGTDYVDTVLLTLAPGINPLEKPFEFIWKSLERLVEQKVVKRIGVCDFTVEQLKHVLTFARIPPSVVSIKMACGLSHMCSKHRTNTDLAQLLEACKEECISVITHNYTDDAVFADLLVDPIFVQHGYSKNQRTRVPWVVRYTAEIENRALVTYRGYFINCQIKNAVNE